MKLIAPIILLSSFVNSQIISMVQSPKPLSFFNAIAIGDNNAALELIAQDKNVVQLKNTDGKSPLFVATMYGATAVVKKLIVSGAYVHETDEHGHTLLMSACSFGCPELITLLLEAGVNPLAKNRYGRDALNLATVYGRTDIITLLAKY